MTGPLLEHPMPDFAELTRVLKGEQAPRRVHLVEIGIDPEVMEAIAERWLGQQRIPVLHPDSSRRYPDDLYYQRKVTVFSRLGYDCVNISPPWENHPPLPLRRTEDTAKLSRGQRDWVEEKCGIIDSWEAYRRFPWDEIKPDLRPIAYAAQNLPGGMKLTISSSLFEHVMDNLLGYEGLFYLLHDDPELVANVFASWGQKVYELYESVIGMEEVGAIFHADDLGFKTSTFVSPKTLNQLVFPQWKKYATLTHEHGKMFWLHSCGNLFGPVMEDLIENVRIDAYHSFQDVILPIADFKARYGQRVAALGGVDMDKLARMDRRALRQYVRGILSKCMPGGRFAFGSGNSIANYIPLANFT